MRFVISGGGTAGHINPALALCAELKKRGHEVIYIGTPAGMEHGLAEAAGMEFIGLEAAGFDRAKPTTFITSSAKILKSSGKAKALFKQRRPDCVVGFGGYVCLPVGLAAAKMNIPLMVHEQNSVPGLANKELVKRGAELALTFDVSRKYFECPDSRIHVVGNPVRDQILAGDGARGRASLGIPEDAVMLLITGGSLGAKHLNETVCALAPELMAIENLYVVQSTGKKNYEEVCQLLGEGYDRWIVRDYIDDMGDMLAACDLTLSRAGSTSLAEISAAGVPSILVPFPYATDDHQTINAADLADCGAAVSWADKDLEDPGFKELLLSLVQDAPRREKMAEAARSLAKPDAVVELADLACSLASKEA